MSLTPNVVDGAIIMASWGNTIRDRTIQQFTNKAELDAWAAPDGCTARTLDTGIVWLRQAGAWRAPPGAVLKATGAAGTSTSNGGLTDLLVVSVGVVPVAATMLVNANVNFGFGSVAINAAPDIWSMATGAVAFQVGAPYQAVAGGGIAIPMAWYVSLSAGQTGDFKLRLNITAMASGVCTWFANATVLVLAT